MTNIVKDKGFGWFCWGVTSYLIAVILWGAYVRVTGSGAGCGSHWPLCNGEVVPRAASVETLIEFTHRATSGVALLLVIAMVIMAFRRFPRGHMVRLASIVTLFFILTEAFIGAGLVLFELVAEDDSFARAWAMSFHLVNTFLLLAAASLTSWAASGGPLPREFGRGRFQLLLSTSLLGMLLVGASGAIAALGNTLFPSSSLAEALRSDFSVSSHLLIRLRIYHPIFAVITSFLILATVFVGSRERKGILVSKLGLSVAVLCISQVVIGIVNVALLAPAWLQLTHLLVSNLLWISIVLFGTVALSTRPVILGEARTAVVRTS